MTNGLLTIAIPTYNRASFLDLCLRRIVEEIASLSESEKPLVKVYVSDNASTDNTAAVLQRYRESANVNLAIVHQNTNEGGNWNIAHCYQAAKTPYVWIMGDDDVILHDRLRTVLEQLKSKTADLLYLNGYPYVAHYLDAPVWGTGQRGRILHPTADHFVRHTHVNLTFITAVVVRSGVCMKTHGFLLEKTSLPHLSWIYTLVKNGQVFITIKERVYAGRMDNSGGYGAFEVFGRQLPRITNEFFGEKSRISQSVENALLVVWFPIFLIEFEKNKSRYLTEDIRKNLSSTFSGNWRYYVFLAPLIILPKSISKLYFQPLRLFRRIFASYLI